jgi:glycosyltransferase involved in cell wall biosynthesis
MATRFASEKGVEVLLEAFRKIRTLFPESKILFAGQHEGVWGEGEYLDRLLPEIRQLEAEGSWEFLGVLALDEMSAFYANLDLLAVPSLNSTETFGLVQIEAMMSGVPVVASELPGVRVPIGMTGMGEIVPVGDAAALADAVCRIFNDPHSYAGSGTDLRSEFSPDRAAEKYERLFAEIARELEK